MKYEFYEWDQDHKYGRWSGKYTCGYIDIKGTSTWLRTSAATCYTEKFAENYKYYDSEDIEKFRIKLADEDEYYPGDYCYFRTYSLKHLLKYMSSDNKNDEYGFVTTKDIFEFRCDNFYDEVYQFVINYPTKPTDRIFAQLYPTDEVWIIHRYNEIMIELNEVLNKFNSQNVTWHSY